MLTTTVFGVPISSPFMNAAGVSCTTNGELQLLASCTPYLGAIVTKSCTMARRLGNVMPRYAELTSERVPYAPYGTLNAMGLPNEGLDYYIHYMKHVHDFAALPLLFVSISGLSLSENTTMLERLLPEVRATLALKSTAGHSINVCVEVNLSCPNVPGKPQVGYDFDDMRSYLAAVDAIVAADASGAAGSPPICWGVKLPPYFDMAHFDTAAGILKSVATLKFVTCINSLGNGLIVDVESQSPIIAPKDGFGGVGGDSVLATAVANVRAFRLRLAAAGVQVIACGGVSRWEHAVMHLLAGACLVQIGSHLAIHVDDNPKQSVFADLHAGTSAWLTRKGYGSVDDCVGKLRDPATTGQPADLIPPRDQRYQFGK